MRPPERLCVAIVSLLSVWAFFFEYIPPTKRVHLWSDIEGYHYPLLNYAAKSVLNGRLPLWDPSMYCGLPFAGNIQAGLFYPPNWLLFASSANLPKRLRGPDLKGNRFQGQHGMRFTAVEIFAFLHVWLAFIFTFLWLRERTSTALPAILGGIGVACGGYLLSQMNHLGVSCGYAWMPFALWGIEQTSRHRQWRYMWKVAIASAFCLLAGYPPTWIAFLILVFAYTIALPGRKRTLPVLFGAVVLSLAISAIQILPAYEATTMKAPESSFGAALPFGKGLYIALALPNYFDYNRTNDGPEAVEVDYLYLGVPVLFGVLWLLRRGFFHGAGPAIAIVMVVLFIASDPTGLILRLVENVPVLPDVLRRYNLLAALPLAGALLAASAVSDFLSRPSGPSTRLRASPIWMAAVVAWSTYLLWLWPPGTPDFMTGPKSAIYTAVSIALFTLGLWLYRSTRRNSVIAFLVLAVLIEFKVFGTNRRFNAVTGNADIASRGDARLGGYQMLGVEDAVYLEILDNPGYRVALYEGPHATDMRFYGLSTPQGFDPFLTDQFKRSVELFQPFRTNRLFDINPLNEEMLLQFGIRWIFARQDTTMEHTLLQHPAFRRLGTGSSYYAVFEYRHAQPGWRFPGDAQMTLWEPEHRAFRVDSIASDRAFILLEQFFPGWTAFIDGKESRIERADGTFQEVVVPAGEHTVEFRYEPLSLKIGEALSALGIFTTLLLSFGRDLRLRLRRCFSTATTSRLDATPK